MKKDELLSGVEAARPGGVRLKTLSMSQSGLVKSEPWKDGAPPLVRNFNISSPEVFEQFALACSSRRPSKNSRDHV
jgi:hypothetical protein